MLFQSIAQKYTHPAQFPVPSFGPYTESPMQVVIQPPPFRFQERTVPVDWRSVQKLHVDKLIRDVDISSLESVILNLTFGEVTSEEVGRIDEVTLTKFIRLSQLVIEYLLYSQDYYRSQISALDAKLKEVHTKYLESEGKNKSLKAELNFQKKELEAKQKAINTFTSIQGYPQPSDNRKVYECKKCKGKFFVSKEYLRAHYKRRHPGFMEQPMEDVSPILKEPVKVQTEIVREAVKVTPQTEHQMEELKGIQEKLKTLTDQVALVASIRESKKENMSENAGHEKEITGLKETVYDLKKMVGEIKNQLPSRWESHGTVTEKVVKSDRGVDARKPEVLEESKLESTVKSKPMVEKVADVTPQKPPMPPPAEKPSERRVQTPERAIERPSPSIIRQDSVHDFSESKQRDSEMAVLESAKPRSASQAEDRAPYSGRMSKTLTRDFEYQGAPGLRARTFYLHKTPTKDLATIKRNMMEEVRKLKKEHKIDNNKDAIQRLESIAVPEAVRDRAKEIMNELEDIE